MPQILPIKELRNTNEISKICHSRNEPIFVTKQGYGDLVVMSMETFDQLMGDRARTAGGAPVRKKPSK